MKRIAFIVAIALTSAAAHADPIIVDAPRAPVTAESAQVYLAQLDKAVKEVCLEAAGPIVGLGFYGYLACLKETRADVAKQDPTGLFGARESIGGTVVAAK